jgi:hypothetical protein
MPTHERRLLIRALAFAWLVRIAIWIVPFAKLYRVPVLIQRRTLSPAGTARSSTEIARAVERASRFTPRASCLVRALTAQVLLARAGHSSSLRISVGRNESGEFGAHAWLENSTGVIIGGGAPLGYMPLPNLDSSP